MPMSTHGAFDEREDSDVMNETCIGDRKMETKKRVSTSQQQSGYRRRQRTSEENNTASRKRRNQAQLDEPCTGQDCSLVVPFTVPSKLTTEWLLRKAPLAMARYLIYARGLWPMSYLQLMQLEREEKTPCGYRSKNLKDGTSRSRRKTTTKGSSPSSRRKQRRAADQMKRLCYDWETALIATGSSGDDLPVYLLISLGSSYGNSSELYLLDFHSLLDRNHEGCKTNVRPSITSQQEERVETILSRKLISSLMNSQTSEGVNALPRMTSPSFRLWFTAGFKTCTKSPPKTRKEEINSFTRDPTLGAMRSLYSWIPRKEFPLQRKQTSKMGRSSIKQSMVIIRFQRDSNLVNMTEFQADATYLENQDISWMSLSTVVKGFRL